MLDWGPLGDLTRGLAGGMLNLYDIHDHEQTAFVPAGVIALFSIFCRVRPYVCAVRRLYDVVLQAADPDQADHELAAGGTYQGGWYLRLCLETRCTHICDDSVRPYVPYDGSPFVR